jgi:hypothetical protein
MAAPCSDGSRDMLAVDDDGNFTQRPQIRRQAREYRW